MARNLRDIETKEVSLVDVPANKKRFLFFKKDTKAKQKKININIESDGTIGGTEITIDGKKLKDLRDFQFSFYPPMDGRDISEAPINCGYSVVAETEDGFKRSETFYLSKGEFNVDTELVTLMKEYFGEDAEIDFEKAEELSDKAVDAIKEALKFVNKYKGDFPDDLKKAVGVLAKYASYGYGYPAKKKDDVEKAGAKFSKDTLEKLKKAIEALEALKSVLPELKEGTQKSGSDFDVEKSIEKITKSIEELENKKKDEKEAELANTIGELTKRLEVVEKGTGVRKSVPGQDPPGSEDNDKWPSFSISNERMESE